MLHETAVYAAHNTSKACLETLTENCAREFTVPRTSCCSQQRAAGSSPSGFARPEARGRDRILTVPPAAKRTTVPPDNE
eukprot:COSAG06_NODE_36811_length_442_cov_1.288630_1_plen_79_part_00